MTPIFDLTDKVAIITGGSRGIGQAIAEAYAAAGAKVVISSRKQDGLDVVADGIRARGGQAVGVVAHNGQKDALKALVAQTITHFGGLDILVNNAATNPHFGPLLEAEDSLWQKTLEVNIMGNVWLTQAAVDVMRAQGRGGKVINVASVNGLRPGHMQGIYSMTKAALINLTQTLAMELAADQIQVNAIAPGLVKTQFARAIWDNDAMRDAVLDRVPQHRLGEPEDIAGMALFLASPAASFATGQVFVVDGGITVPLL
jgi:NAD(P)-dependent dehydrogenase (short-subunit alcohol dehydrogenase family)